MATKKSPTSKTAHVLNVISGDHKADPEPTPVEGQPAATIAAAPPAARHSLPPILENARASDALLSEQIRAAMEEELTGDNPEKPADEPETDLPADMREEMTADLPTAADDPVEEAGDPFDADDAFQSFAPVSVSPVAPAPDVIPMPVAAPAPAPAPIPQPELEPSPPIPRHPSEPEPPIRPILEGLVYVNIMEALVEEKADRYIKMFGLCNCPRCMIDVKALTLSNLPAKYVVMREGMLVPMLTVYEGRFSAAITAQLIQACKVVMDTPRHERS